MASHTAIVQGALSDEVDRVEIGREVLHRWSKGLQLGMQARSDPRIPATRFVDVQYPDLTADPMGTVRRIYEHAQIPLTGEAEQRMQQYRAENPKGKHGEHRYSLSAFALDPEEIARRFQDYCDHFGVRPEPVPAG